MEMPGREILDSRNGTCKGPGEATSLLHLRKRKRPTCLAKARGAWERSEKQAGARSGMTS